MTRRRTGRTALPLVLALTLALTLAAGGCSSGDDTDDGAGGGSGSPDASSSGPASSDPSAAVGTAADDAAAAYLVELERYQAQVARAAARAAAWTEGDSAAQWRSAERAFVAALEAAPELEAVDAGADASASYASVRTLAEHAQGFVAEHEWMTRWDIAENVRVNSELYTIGSEQYAANLRISTAYESAMAGPGNTARKMQAALQVMIPAQLASLARARRKVEAMAGPDSFTPSLRDHVLHEIDEVAALGERYLAYVEAVPAEMIDRDLFRNGFSSGLALPGGGVSNAPADRTVAVRTLLADGLADLLDAAAGAGVGGVAGADLPVAGDIYRELVLRTFVPHSAKDGDARSLAVEEQLYWLWHVREIEDTPDEEFEDARLTIKLQEQGPRGLALVNVDSRFDELAAVSTAMADIINTGPESMAASKPWLVELLGRPFPTALDDAVGLAREAAALLPDDASPASPELMAIGPDLLEELERAADDLDRTRTFRRAFRTAVDGTRPSAG